jgi:hypothetical protein
MLQRPITVPSAARLHKVTRWKRSRMTAPMRWACERLCLAGIRPNSVGGQGNVTHQHLRRRHCGLALVVCITACLGPHDPPERMAARYLSPTKPAFIMTTRLPLSTTDSDRSSINQRHPSHQPILLSHIATRAILPYLPCHNPTRYRGAGPVAGD